MLVRRPQFAGLLAAALLVVVIVAFPSIKGKREAAFVEVGWQREGVYAKRFETP